MPIIYRHYRNGDDEQLADLFNRAFQMNGGSIVKTSKSWNWRYVQSPGFEPEMVQIAEDLESNLIVGSVHANLIENIIVDGKKYLTGDINDVACHPDYTKKGIAKNLMEMAINYMKDKGCAISLLSASYNSFTRQKLYSKLGYQDFKRELLSVQFPNIIQFLKNLPIFTFIFPALLTISYLPRFFNRMRIRFNSFFNDFSYEIIYNRKHNIYMNAANSIIRKYYSGFREYDRDKVLWARINVPALQQRPTYVFMKKANKVIAGAILTHLNLYAFKFGVKMRLGIINEIFLDEKIFKNKRNLHFGYIYLIDKVIKAATQRFIGIIISRSDYQNEALMNGFKGLNFFTFKNDMVMIKKIKEDIKFPKLKRPFYIPTSLTLSIP